MRFSLKLMLSVFSVLFISVQGEGESFSQPSVTVGSNCQWQWATVDVPDYKEAKIRHGRQTGVYTDEKIVPKGAHSLLCSDLPNGNQLGEHFAIVEVFDNAGLKSVSQEIHYMVAQSEFCLLGELNGVPVKICLPIVAVP